MTTFMPKVPEFHSGRLSASTTSKMTSTACCYNLLSSSWSHVGSCLGTCGLVVAFWVKGMWLFAQICNFALVKNEGWLTSVVSHNRTFSVIITNVLFELHEDLKPQIQARDKTTQSWMDRRFSVGEDTCKHRRWIFFWRSYMFSAAGAKIIKEDLQRSPTDSICCATQEKHWERPLHWLEGGLEQPAQKLSSSVWFLLIWLQEMGTVCHLHERYSHNKEMPYSMVNFSLGWIQVLRLRLVAGDMYERS